MTFGKGRAPCGHPGTYIVGQYIRCNLGCDKVEVEQDDDEEISFADLFDDESDGVPQHVDPEKTQPLCPRCGTDKVQVYPGMSMNGKDLWHCHGCQRSFMA